MMVVSKTFHKFAERNPQRGIHEWKIYTLILLTIKTKHL